MRKSGANFDPVRDIPDLFGRVVIVTGANSGIGFETAKLLHSRGATVYLACRNGSRARKAIDDIVGLTSNMTAIDRLAWLPLDLSTISGTRQAVDSFLRMEDRLDVLINNAAMLGQNYELNEDGIELTMATNYIGHFTLTALLLPLLSKTAQRPNTDVRIVTVTSEMHTHLPSRTRLRTIADLNAPMSGLCCCFWRYCLSKLAHILFTRTLQRRLDAQLSPIIATCVHPGMVASANMITHVPPFLRPLLPLLTLSPPRGCHTTVFAAVSPVVRLAKQEYAGKYLVPFGKVGKVGKAADGEDGEELWKVSESIVSSAGRR